MGHQARQAHQEDVLHPATTRRTSFYAAERAGAGGGPSPRVTSFRHRLGEAPSGHVGPDREQPGNDLLAFFIGVEVRRQPRYVASSQLDPCAEIAETVVVAKEA